MLSSLTLRHTRESQKKHPRSLLSLCQLCVISSRLTALSLERFSETSIARVLLSNKVIATVASLFTQEHKQRLQEEPQRSLRKVVIRELIRLLNLLLLTREVKRLLRRNELICEYHLNSSKFFTELFIYLFRSLFLFNII